MNWNRSAMRSDILGFRCFVAAYLLLAIAAPSPVAAAIMGDQRVKLLADDGKESDHFGWSVAVSGDTAIVGSWNMDFSQPAAGAAYLFDATTGAQLAKLAPEVSMLGDEFGRTVAIRGNVAVVGAPRSSISGPGSGSAYLFNATTGAELLRLAPENAESVKTFGRAVGISDSAVIVAAANDGRARCCAAAYLFDPQTGLQIQKLVGSDISTTSSFGAFIDIAGDTVVVGVPDDLNFAQRTGAAVLFELATGLQTAKLVADDAAGGDGFGNAVAVDGKTAIVGARFKDRGAGAAYLFDVLTGEQFAKLTPDAGESGQFGVSVDIEGDLAIVGASRGEDGVEVGAVYLFDVATGEQLAKLTASDGEFEDRFGFSVALEGNRAIIGAVTDGDNGFESGSAYVFDLAVPEPAAGALAVLAAAFGTLNRFGTRRLRRH